MTDTEQRRGWVLVVDDDVGLATTVSETLSQWVDCQVATTPADALALRALRPHLVGALVDLHLSEADGLRDVAEPLRALEPGLDIRILSGAGPADPAVQRAVDAGFWFALEENASEQLRALGPLWGRMAGLMLSSLEPPGSATRPVVRGARTTPLPDPDESLIEARLAELRASGALSGRQLEILVLQVQGASHGDIARVLGITAKTIEHHSREAKVRTGKSLFEHAHDLVADTGRTLRSRRV